MRHLKLDDCPAASLCNPQAHYGGANPPCAILRAMLACVSLTKAYGTDNVFSNVSLAVQPGECVCVTGPAGSGKSALLRMLVGVEHPTDGAIEVDGVNLDLLPPEVLRLYRTRLGVMFQEPQVLGRMTVAENIAYPLEIIGALPSSGSAVPDMLKRIGLSTNALEFPDALSVSQRMMLCIGRALISNPMIILADEPFSSLDSTQRATTLSLLLEAKKRGASLLIFTQDAAVAEPLGARVVSLTGTVSQPLKTQQPSSTLPPVSAEQPKEATPGRKIKITSIGS